MRQKKSVGQNFKLRCWTEQVIKRALIYQVASKEAAGSPRSDPARRRPRFDTAAAAGVAAARTALGRPEPAFETRGPRSRASSAARTCRLNSRWSFEAWPGEVAGGGVRCPRWQRSLVRSLKLLALAPCSRLSWNRLCVVADEAWFVFRMACETC